MDCNIVGQSDLITPNGNEIERYFVISQTDVFQDTSDRRLTILKSDKTGTFSKELSLDKYFEEIVKNHGKIEDFLEKHNNFRIEDEEILNQLKEKANDKTLGILKDKDIALKKKLFRKKSVARLDNQIKKIKDFKE